MESERRERRRVGALSGIAVAAVVVLLAAVIPSPYAVVRPGPVVDTLGEVTLEEGADPVPVIEIAGVDTETEGTLNLLTVSIAGSPDAPESWLALLPAALSPSQVIAPLSDYYADGETSEDRDAATAVQMASSQSQAAAAAFRQTGHDVGVELGVAGVTEGGPAEGLLEEGDVIASVDGAAVADYDALRAAIVAAGAGTALELGVVRDGEEIAVRVVPETDPGSGEPLIGALLSISYDLPAEVTVNLEDIGGPSAGLAFSLAMVDLLTDGGLVGDLTVSTTGTLSDSGEVGPIGGLEQKMWGASQAGSDLFLMPIGNCADVPERIPGGLEVAPVATLEEAIDAIEAAAAGSEVAGLERCDAAG